MANVMYGFTGKKSVSRDRKLTSGLLVTYKFLFSKLLEDVENANLTSLFAQIKSYSDKIDIEMTHFEVQDSYTMFLAKYHDASKLTK